MIKHNITTIEGRVLTGLGPMFKSLDDLIDYIELLDSGLDIASKLYSASNLSSETISSLESEVSTWISDVAKSSKIDINPSNPSMWGVLVSKAMHDTDKDDYTNKNILDDHFGYNLTEIYNYEYKKLEKVAYDNSSKVDKLATLAKNKSNTISRTFNSSDTEKRLTALQSTMKGIIDINSSAGTVILLYIGTVSIISLELGANVLAIGRSEIDSLLKPKNESCFAYIR